MLKSKQKTSRPRQEIQVRQYRPGEEQILQQIYVESTRKLVAKDYSETQTERWIAKHADLAEWTMRLQGKNPFVAELNGMLLGFAELDPDGHIDFFYCHPDWQGQGAGTRLLATIEGEASRLKLLVLNTEVSVTAHPFFTRRGFNVLEVRNPIICGTPAKQYIMQKKIG